MATGTPYCTVCIKIQKKVFKEWSKTYKSSKCTCHYLISNSWNYFILILYSRFRILKREKYSRRRAHNDDEDIDYINERNMKFNKKLERFYGEHTLEIKQNLERGTAV